MEHGPGQLVERIETRLSLQHHRRPLHHLFNAVRPADAFAAVQTPPATFYFSSSYSYKSPAAFSFSSPIDPPPPPPPSLVNRSSRSGADMPLPPAMCVDISVVFLSSSPASSFIPRKYEEDNFKLLLIEQSVLLSKGG